MMDRQDEQECRVNRTAQDAADRAEAAQAAAETARYERMEGRIRRTIHALFLVMASLWLTGVATILLWRHWP